MADVYDTDYVLLYRHKKSYREGDVLHHLIDQNTQHPHTKMHLKVFRLNMTYRPNYVRINLFTHKSKILIL